MVILRLQAAAATIRFALISTQQKVHPLEEGTLAAIDPSSDHSIWIQPIQL